MNKYALLVALLLLTKIGWTQNPNLGYKYAIKLYNLASYDEFTKTTNINNSAGTALKYSTKSIQFLHPTIAFQWKTKKWNFHEMELTNLMLKQSSIANEIINDTISIGPSKIMEDVTTTAIALRYEYILNFNKTKDSKWLPSLAIGANPYYRQHNYTHQTTTRIFPKTEKQLGLRTFLIPRMTYYITSKIFIDANIPISLFDAYMLKEKELNPALSQKQVCSYHFNSFLKMWSARIGVGFKI